VAHAERTFDTTQLFDIELKDPPKWEGETMNGLRASKATRDQLIGFARFQEWRAKKMDESNETDAQGRPRSFYPKRDAETARKWAQTK
jgi:hypothetical protein